MRWKIESGDATASKTYDNAENNKSDNRENFDDGEDKLGFAVSTHQQR
jgi:hypothetical protein